MSMVLAFLISVAAGLACSLICKWLDSDDKDN